MKHSIDNRMVDAFGEEFNLSTTEIIECIKRVYTLEVDDTNFSAKDVEVALYNRDYYIRPGNAQIAFMKEWGKIFVWAKVCACVGLKSEESVWQ